MYITVTTEINSLEIQTKWMLSDCEILVDFYGFMLSLSENNRPQQVWYSVL